MHTPKLKLFIDTFFESPVDYIHVDFVFLVKQSEQSEYITW